MKINKKILIALMLAGLSTATIAEEKDINVMVKDVDGVVTKTVTVNGTELSPEEIAELEASGEIKIIHLDGIDAEIGDTITLMNVSDGNSDSDEIKILVNTDGDKTTKTVILNGKELSDSEIAELTAQGKLKSINIDATGIDAGSMHKVMFFDTDQNVSRNGTTEMIVQTQFVQADDDNATLGFMANIKDDGWHVISVIESSGAEESGLKAGDVIKFMGDQDLSQGTKELSETLDLVAYNPGDMVDLEVLRGEKLIYMSVEARKNSAFDMIMKIDENEVGSIHGKPEFISVDDFSKMTSPNVTKNSFIHLISSNGKLVDLDDVSVKLPEILGNMNIFITDGNSTSKLLGEDHKMSALTKGLGSYFGTKGGVLMMNVSQDNIFGLKDGDVVKSIDGVGVETPKDVIKQLLKADNQEDIKLKIVRHKRNKTLKYNK